MGHLGNFLPDFLLLLCHQLENEVLRHLQQGKQIGKTLKHLDMSKDLQIDGQMQNLGHKYLASITQEVD
ncbi:unnamed protein product [Clavelina lepadiformis]|uniref:Uncharacterized protein n=1 Tax=Clavelina lepadiformis TaxID=159417 RepID=A0ABP0FUZ9_CLALP